MRTTIKGITDFPADLTKIDDVTSESYTDDATADTKYFTAFGDVGAILTTTDAFNYVAKFTPITSSAANFRYQKDAYVNAAFYTAGVAFAAGTAVQITGAFAATSIAALSVAAALAF